jgi:hypothetical protein
MAIQKSFVEKGTPEHSYVPRIQKVVGSKRPPGERSLSGRERAGRPRKMATPYRKRGVK